jgi:hypothetical protein
MDRPHDRSYWVIPDRLLAAEYPTYPYAALDDQRLASLLASGFDYFLDLTLAGEAVAYQQLVTARGATHRRYPIQDMGVPLNRAEMCAILDELDGALALGRRVYLHCVGGIGRTGTVVGCYLVRHGASGTEALLQIARWWETTAKKRVFPRSPQTDQQMAYVLDWEHLDPQRK